MSKDTKRRIIASLVLCLFIGVLVAMVVDEAQAQTTRGDQSIAGKRGVAGSLSSGKETDDSKAPSTTQKIIGIGSVFVAIIVVKFF